MDIAFAAAFLSDKNRNYVQRLLETAFPLDERPPFAKMERRGGNYHLCVVQKNGGNVGVLGYWDFGETVYIEHFAIEEKQRNKCLGTETLATFLSRLAKGTQVVLEMEPPADDTTRRRVEFYKRNGFYHNPHIIYKQPPYRPGGQWLTMHIMSLQPLQPADFEPVCNRIYAEVYDVDEE